MRPHYLVLAALLFVTGCADSHRFDWGFLNPAPPVEQQYQKPLEPTPPPVAPRVDPNGNRLSPAAKSAAGTQDKGAPLMECVSNACKVNCAASVKAQFRPKWCKFFKTPA